MNNMVSASGDGFRWYGFIIGMAILLCIGVAYFLVKKRGYNPDMVFNIAVICIPCAILGARLYYIFFDIVGGKGSFVNWFKPKGSFTLMRFIGFELVGSEWQFEGLSGLAVYGGLIFAALGALIVRKFNKKDKNPTNQMRYIQMLDAFFALIILGQCIGRWGNFINQEAYGNLVTNPNLKWFPFAVFIDAKDAWFQATFFYESFLNFIGFFVLLYLCYGKRKSFDGFVFSAYCIWYGMVRLFVEGLRSDSLYFLGMRVSQILSGLLVLAGIAIIVWHVFMARRSGKKAFIFVPEGRLNTDYYGYEKTIMYINSMYTKEGKLKNATTAETEEQKRFSYNAADDLENIASIDLDNTLSTNTEDNEKN